MTWCSGFWKILYPRFPSLLPLRRTRTLIFDQSNLLLYIYLKPKKLWSDVELLSFTCYDCIMTVARLMQGQESVRRIYKKIKILDITNCTTDVSERNHSSIQEQKKPLISPYLWLYPAEVIVSDGTTYPRICT